MRAGGKQIDSDKKLKDAHFEGVYCDEGNNVMQFLCCVWYVMGGLCELVALVSFG